MTPLFLDIGNSHIKLAIKRGVTWKVVYRAGNGSIEDLPKAIDELPAADLLVISSVRKDVLDQVMEILNYVDIKVLTNSLIERVNLDYDTPETLGMDRFLTCYGAISSTNHDVICVDAGTACTIDWMTGDGVFRGGVIMPGLKLYYETVNRHLPELPPVTYATPKHWPGKSTVESLHWGTSGSYLMAIEGFLRKYEELIDGEAELFLTGGDSVFLESSLNTTLHIHHRPYLLFDGMESFWKDLS